MLSALGVIWGSSFFAIEIALISFDPNHISSCRIIIGLLTLIFFSLLFRIKIVTKKKTTPYWISCLGVALFSNVIPFTLLAIAQDHLTSIFVGLCMSTIPIIILVFAHFLSEDEKINTKRSIGIALGVFGTVLLISSKSGINGNSFSLGGQIFVWLCILAPFCYASGAIIIKRSVQSDYMEFSTHSLLIASLISAPIFLLTGELPSSFNINSIIAILYLGIFPTGIATIILVSLIKNEGAVFISLVNFKVPIWSTIFGVFLLKESIPSNFSISFLLILSGILICQIQTKKIS